MKDFDDRQFKIKSMINDNLNQIQEQNKDDQQKVRNQVEEFYMHVNTIHKEFQNQEKLRLQESKQITQLMSTINHENVEIKQKLIASENMIDRLSNKVGDLQKSVT